MSAPERFQVGDTVRCVNDELSRHELSRLTAGAEYAVTKVGAGHIKIDGDDGDWFEDRFVLVSRPKPPALDPFAWDLEAFREAARWTNSPAWDGDIFAWSRFCYWAAQSNLAARFLPTVAAARTRASNGRDVPVAYVDVRLRADTAAVYAAHPGGGVITTDHYNDVRQACRRALGGGA